MATSTTDSGADLVGDPEADGSLTLFLAQRTRLFWLAHRITGDAGSAEDVVQDAWLRWQRTDRSVIKNPAAFLTTTVTNLAINHIQSARHRHEAPTESPLAELAPPGVELTLEVERTLEVEDALAGLMARLTPAELAAYLLRKAFEYPYGEIAAMLRTSSNNARQLVRRAQQRIDGERARSVDEEDHRRLVAAFRIAARAGEIGALEALLVGAARPSMRQSRQHVPVQSAWVA